MFNDNRNFIYFIYSFVTVKIKEISKQNKSEMKMRKFINTKTRSITSTYRAHMLLQHVSANRRPQPTPLKPRRWLKCEQKLWRMKCQAVAAGCEQTTEWTKKIALKRMTHALLGLTQIMANAKKKTRNISIATTTITVNTNGAQKSPVRLENVEKACLLMI